MSLHQLRIGNQLLPMHGMSLAVADCSHCATPTISPGMDLEFTLGLVPGVVGFERPLSLVAFLECLEGRPDLERRRVRWAAPELEVRCAELEREAAAQRAVATAAAAELELLRGLLDGQRERAAAAEAVATRAQVEMVRMRGVLEHSAELEERRRARGRGRRAPALTVLVDLDVD